MLSGVKQDTDEVSGFSRGMTPRIEPERARERWGGRAEMERTGKEGKTMGTDVVANLKTCRQVLVWTLHQPSAEVTALK